MPVFVFQVPQAIVRIERIHLQLPRCISEKRGPINSLVQVVVTQYVANVLAEEALNALAEFLRAVDIFLLPCRQVPSALHPAYAA